MMETTDRSVLPPSTPPDPGSENRAAVLDRIRAELDAATQRAHDAMKFARVGLDRRAIFEAGGVCEHVYAAMWLAQSPPWNEWAAGRYSTAEALAASWGPEAPMLARMIADGLELERQTWKGIARATASADERTSTFNAAGDAGVAHREWRKHADDSGWHHAMSKTARRRSCTSHRPQLRCLGTSRPQGGRSRTGGVRRRTSKSTSSGSDSSGSSGGDGPGEPRRRLGFTRLTPCEHRSPANLPLAFTVVSAERARFGVATDYNTAAKPGQRLDLLAGTPGDPATHEHTTEVAA